MKYKSKVMKAASQMLILTVTVYVLSTAKQSWKQKRILYQTESLELHHLISHLLNVCCLAQSVPLSPSYILVTVGLLNSYRARITSGISDVVRSVEWHHTP